MAAWILEADEEWDLVVVEDPKDGSSGGCFMCTKIDGTDASGRYLLKFYTDGALHEGAGKVACPECWWESVFERERKMWSACSMPSSAPAAT